MKVNINTIVENPNNPRYINKEKFKKLVKSLKDLPSMLDVRPIVVDENMIVLGGNMRLKALKEAGFTEVKIHQVKNWSEEQKKEFIIKDNSSFGEWDWDILANEWDLDLLDDWGLDLNKTLLEENPYTKKIEAPKYEAGETKPNLKECYNIDKYNALVKNINNSKLDKDLKEFLLLSATRFITLDFSKIADLYPHLNKDEQNLFEEQALVIIDFEKAIESGYVNLNKKITKQYLDEHQE
tara:strand:+ start:3223 stop:3939 length:717 start_codon:yes stop_codon:yes gene_type:complete